MSTLIKEVQGFGMVWEKEYGYAQSVKIGDTVWISGQLGHDALGNLLDGMDAQVKQSYANISRLLEGYQMSMDDVVEEVLYVLDMGSAFKTRTSLGRQIYTDPMQIASTLIAVSGLALPGQLIEIKVVAMKLR